MKRYQLCCDMDGVLCDFASGALKMVNQTLAEKDKYKNTNPELYDTITKALNEIETNQATFHDIRIGTPLKNVRKLLKDVCRHNEDFWANLDWVEGGKEVWDAIKNHDPYILSAPMGMSEESKAGKIRWVKKHLGLPDSSIILDDDKFNYTEFDGRTGVLIDDLDYNIGPYRKNGGIAIHHNPATVEKTKQLIEKYKD